MQYICNHSGIPSKGYLSDVMKKRRKLSLKHVEGIANVFSFNVAQRNVFKSLCELEHCKNLNEREQVVQNIYVARKRLEVKHLSLSSGNFDPYTMAKCYCSFGVGRNSLSIDEISKCINESHEDVSLALETLIQKGWVIKDNDCYRLTGNQHIVFNEGDSNSFHKRLIKSSVESAMGKIDLAFEHNDVSYFESSSLSVDKKSYKKVLKEIKTLMDESMCKLETTEGNQIVHFNLQILPENF